MYRWTVSKTKYDTQYVRLVVDNKRKDIVGKATITKYSKEEILF